MDKRTKNRIHEHSREGHRLTVNQVNTNNPTIKTDRVCWDCTCGWAGWLDHDSVNAILKG